MQGSKVSIFKRKMRYPNIFFFYLIIFNIIYICFAVHWILGLVMKTFSMKMTMDIKSHI